MVYGLRWQYDVVLPKNQLLVPVSIQQLSSSYIFTRGTEFPQSIRQGRKVVLDFPRLARSQTHEHTVLLRFLDIILRVLRLVVSVYTVYITNWE
jgi:hypothetical protein